jgi:predicted glutamate--cysteine ligase
VVTASVHINLGLTDMEGLFAACRLVRCEAALLLAISASSPFLDGACTGAHSQRWLQFPLTPQAVPLFESHRHYIDWVEQQLQLGTMQNVRHLWTSVRPNGDNRPHDLNRLEIRICDLITDPLVLLAVTAFAEARIHQLLREPELHDPQCASSLSLEQLAELADANDQAAACRSLDALLRHWRTGESVLARQWLAAELEGMAPLAQELGLDRWLAPLQTVLQHGNQAQQWLESHAGGMAVGALIAEGAREMERSELQLTELLATDGAAALG